jgi:mannose-6-phosphate isomerase-like protein (cupin superfamily)
MNDGRYTPGLYSPDDRDGILAMVHAEGWAPLLIDEPAGYTYTPHHHEEDKLIVVLEGEMAVTLGAEDIKCRPGDRLIIPGGVTHAAVMGDQGCIYFWSEQVRQ